MGHSNFERLTLALDKVLEPKVRHRRHLVAPSSSHEEAIEFLQQYLGCPATFGEAHPVRVANSALDRTFVKISKKYLNVSNQV